MSKAVLVMDMPSSCNKCHLLDEPYDLCIPMDKDVSDYCSETRPDWCPLRELPEKKDSMNLNSIMEKCKDRDSIMHSVLKQFIVDGYNACIDELLKEE